MLAGFHPANSCAAWSPGTVAQIVFVQSHGECESKQNHGECWALEWLPIMWGGREGGRAPCC
jgi:hypothetical protein